MSPHSVVSEKQSFHVWCGEWHCPGHSQSLDQKRPLHREAYYHRGAWCSVGGWGFHPVRTVHSSDHNMADQCLGCVAKFCWCILATYLTFLPLLAENSPHPTILQYAAVFVLINYTAWCHQRIIENAKLHNNKHTQYLTGDLLGRLHIKWQQLVWLPFQSVLTLYYQDWPAFTFQLVR